MIQDGLIRPNPSFIESRIAPVGRVSALLLSFNKFGSRYRIDGSKIPIGKVAASWPRSRRWANLCLERRINSNWLCTMRKFISCSCYLRWCCPLVHSIVSKAKVSVQDGQCWDGAGILFPNFKDTDVQGVYRTQGTTGLPGSAKMDGKRLKAPTELKNRSRWMRYNWLIESNIWAERGAIHTVWLVSINVNPSRMI